ncbi:hypothetical protein HYG84_10070 [Alkaliphilus sp. B6464]|nr:hypothetical protein HYG84_10070 [Alkaliphilus sp. B6464]
MEKTHLVVFNPRMARLLLKMGYMITDIKPHKNVENASVFIFLNEEGLEEELNKMINEFKNK